MKLPFFAILVLCSGAFNVAASQGGDAAPPASPISVDNPSLSRRPRGVTPLPPELAAKELISSSSQTLAPGVTYVQAHFKNLFGDGPERTFFVLLDWKTCGTNVTLAIVRNPERREKPSTLAAQTKALAAVNGTYHSMTDPSQPYFELKVDGKLIPSQLKGGDGTLAFNRGEMPYMGTFKKELLEKYDNVMSGDGVPGLGEPFPDYSDQSPEGKKKRAACRAPRTFAGNDLTNRVTVIGVVDGRQRESIGVNYVEARKLLELWGCDPEALVSLDGGGSSVMVTREGEGHKVRNVPSDGYPLLSRERRVAESLQILRLAP